jgi:hypothetical protein
MNQVKPLSVGDRVKITEEGAIGHQRHHDDYIGIVAKVSTPLIRTAAETAKQIIFTFPESGFKGKIVDKRGRWWGQPGYDYLVRWDENFGQSWHLSKHLLLIK